MSPSSVRLHQPAPERGPARVERVSSSVLPTDDGIFDLHVYLDEDGTEHAVLALLPDGGGPQSVPLVRVHSECLTGDALGSHRCDCGDQLEAARRAIAAAGHGALVYLRGHEGRGIGLAAKVAAYGLQDRGLDTVDANLALGLPADDRSYLVGAQILLDLGLDRVRLLSANPDKARELAAHGVEVVERLSVPVPDRVENRAYLQAKRARMGHEDAGAPVDAWSALLAGQVPAGPSAALLTGPDADLVDRYAWMTTTPAFTIAQLGQSLDGFIACRTGDAVFVTGDEDREHLHRLRALVDAVVVGVQTVTVDDCRLTVRAVAGRSPVRVVLDPSARAPRTAAVLTDPAAPTLWLVGPDADVDERSLAPHVEVVRVALADSRMPPCQVLAALAGRGLRRVLVEGGGRTVSSFLDGGLLDRLYLTTAPVLIGDGVPGLRFTGTPRMADALRAPSRRFVFGEDVCVELDLTGMPTRD